MPKNHKSVTFHFSSRQLEMSLEILQGALAQMAEKLAAATDPREIAFYSSRPAHFHELLTLLGKGGGPVPDSKRKIRMSSEQYHMLHSSLAHRNLQETLFVHDMPTGGAKEARRAAHDAWSDFCDQLGRKDPRQFDTSQDAAPEEDADDVAADEDED